MSNVYQLNTVKYLKVNSKAYFFFLISLKPFFEQIFQVHIFFPRCQVIVFQSYVSKLTRKYISYWMYCIQFQILYCPISTDACADLTYQFQNEEIFLCLMRWIFLELNDHNISQKIVLHWRLHHTSSMSPYFINKVWLRTRRKNTTLYLKYLQA